MTYLPYLTLPYLSLSMVFWFFNCFWERGMYMYVADMMDTGHCGEFG